MTPYQLFLLILSLYIGVLVATGFYFSKRQKSLVDFWLAGKKVGGLSIGFSAAASWLTAGAILAVTGFFILLGMGSIWGFVAPNIIALLGIALFVKKIKNLPAITQPELLELRYGSFIRLPVALIITVVMILFAVADIKGFAMVLQVFYGVTQLHAALIVSIAVAIYVTLGGLSAVIATDVLQFVCLAAFVLVMAIATTTGAAHGNAGEAVHMFTSMPAGWWNPMSIGLPMVLIFVLAIIPGWITEQDPWQRVWAARNVTAARNGMVFGAILVALVFAGCAVIAVGLNSLYPDIAAMGFPMGMEKAEPAILTFLMDNNSSSLVIALCAVALATAAMSCTDTFAASGGSCIARDIYQRYLRPSATMKEMQLVNRIAVLVIIASATAESFWINSIIDAIHIATFVASSSYFFALMGGLYWRRATGAGAAASLCSGFVVQVLLVWFDLSRTAPMGAPYLETVHPILMSHGVIVAMLVSGVTFWVVSLVTSPSPQFRLAPFFKDEAKSFAAGFGEEVILRDTQAFTDIRTERCGGIVQLHAEEKVARAMNWKRLVSFLCNENKGWFCESGMNSVCKYVGGAVVTRVNLTRGESLETLWLAVEGADMDFNHLACAMVVARGDVQRSIAVLRER